MTRSTRTTTTTTALIAVLAILAVALAFGAGDPTASGLGQLGSWFAGLFS